VYPRRSTAAVQTASVKYTIHFPATFWSAALLRRFFTANTLTFALTIPAESSI